MNSCQNLESCCSSGCLWRIDNHEAEKVTSYEFTAIGQKGEEFLREFTADWYGKFMVGWENAMYHYLTKGEKLA